MINLIKESLELLMIFLMSWFLYEDSKRIIKAFFLHLERKLLIIHSIKLGAILVLIYKFRRYIPYYNILLALVSVLFLLFLAVLTLKQVEFSVKDAKTLKFTTFKYGRNKLIEYMLYFIAGIINTWEQRRIKEKSKEMMYVAIFPVQKYVMISISGMEFTQRKEKFISENDLKDIKENLEPGDILLKRNDWQATNFGISGFWTHTGMYIGGLEELDNYFKDVKALNGGLFSEKLKEINKELYGVLQKYSDLAVIEAIQEGVVIKPISNIGKVDYFSAVRARISKDKKMEAILKAYGFVGSPYDYFLDMHSDDAFVCTEVIKKSFGNSISIETQKKFGKQIVYPNSIAKKFVQERNRKIRELDFVLFYDLDIKTRKAFKSNETEFLKSYKRNIAYYRKMDMLRYFSTIIGFK